MASNYYVGILASDDYTTDTVSEPQRNPEHRGLHLVVNVTAISGDGIIPRIVGIGPTEAGDLGYPSLAEDYLLLEGPTITTTGTTILKIYPGIATIPNGAASDFLPWLWKIAIEHLGSPETTATYSVFALLEG